MCWLNGGALDENVIVRVALISARVTSARNGGNFGAAGMNSPPCASGSTGVPDTLTVRSVSFAAGGAPVRSLGSTSFCTCTQYDVQSSGGLDGTVGALTS